MYLDVFKSSCLFNYNVFTIFNVHFFFGKINTTSQFIFHVLILFTVGRRTTVYQLLVIV